MHTYPVKMKDIVDGESRRVRRGQVSRNSPAFKLVAHTKKRYALGKGDPPAKPVDPSPFVIIAKKAMFARIASNLLFHVGRFVSQLS